MVEIKTAEENRIKAVILDLDGVITRTAELHSAAWKEMFDGFLYEKSRQTGAKLTPLDRDRDYREYIDGRPRYEGAQAFLESRGIILPFGNSCDDPSKETVCGLGNRKNSIYLRLLHEKGPNVYPDAIESIKNWRNNQMKTAVISASKNSREVLSTTGISGLFDAIVDGNDSIENNIRGKPAPDIFLLAAELLHVNPRASVIIEDSSAGLLGGKEGGFAYKIGISRNGNYGLLYRSGADIVVSSLDALPDFRLFAKRSFDAIPSAIKYFTDIEKRLKQGEPLLALDYDGTLTPIVARPEQAVLSDAMRGVIYGLARKIKVAVVSGRDLNIIKQHIGLENIFYAGSHGFDIQGPGKIRMESEQAKSILPDLDDAEKRIKEELSGLKGILFERKKFMMAVHYRNVDDLDMSNMHNVLDKIVSQYDRLTMVLGKKIFEIRPAINWHKGKAVAWVINHLFNNSDTVVPLYIGDDITDEDAFRELKGNGISILVGSHSEDSGADYRLTDSSQVFEFLKRLDNEICEGQN